MKKLVGLLVFLVAFTTGFAQQGYMGNYWISNSLSLGKGQRDATAANDSWLDIGKDTTNKGFVIPRALTNGFSTTRRGLFYYNLGDSVLHHKDGSKDVRYMTYKDTALIRNIADEVAKNITALLASKSGNTVTLRIAAEDTFSVNISVADADSSTTNELQTLGFSGPTSLSISSGNSVNLPLYDSTVMASKNTVDTMRSNVYSALGLKLSSTTAASTYVSLSGSYTNPSWIASLPWSKITSTPTTLSGYGITDATSTARAAITFTTTGTSGAATYNSTTGALNIPTISSFSNDITVNGLTVGRGGGNRANNIVIGTGAGAATMSNSTTYPNWVIGPGAGAALTFGYAHMLGGYRAGYNLIGGDDNYLSGYRAGYNLTQAYYILGIGTDVFFNLTDVPTVSLNNLGIGHNTGRNLGSGSQRNTLVGLFSMGNGANVGTTSHNSTLGEATLYNLYQGNFNTAAGRNALFTATNMSFTSAFGFNAGYYATGNACLWLGGYDGSSHTTATNSIFISDGEGNLGVWFNASKAATFTSTIKTVQPSGNGAGAYKFGKVITTGTPVTLQTDKFVEVDIDGTIYKLAIVQ